jgi:hypothetical protein
MGRSDEQFRELGGVAKIVRRGFHRTHGTASAFLTAAASARKPGRGLPESWVLPRAKWTLPVA